MGQEALDIYSDGFVGSREETNRFHETEERRPIEEYVRLWGNSASITLFDDSCHVFKTPSIDGIIGYKLHRKRAIAFGDPLCKPEDKISLGSAFHEYCKKNKWRVIHAAASRDYALWAFKNLQGSLIEVGEELILDPFDNPKSGMKGRALRNKVNNSLRAGILIAEHIGANPKLEEEMEKVRRTWLEEKQGPQIYLAESQRFDTKTGKRWFYAKSGENIVGVLILTEMKARKGWLVHFLMTTKQAPVGTSEQLILSATKVLQEENCRSLSFGVAQLEALGEIQGLGAFSETLARLIFNSINKIFRNNKRRRYWRKFKPQKEAAYLLFSEPRIPLLDVISLMRAFNVNL